MFTVVSHRRARASLTAPAYSIGEGTPSNGLLTANYSAPRLDTPAPVIFNEPRRNGFPDLVVTLLVHYPRRAWLDFFSRG